MVNYDQVGQRAEPIASGSAHNMLGIYSGPGGRDALVNLRVIGAGHGRTGTTSLKAALELLLGAACYHMDEVFGHPEHVDTWRAAIRGEPADLATVIDGYAATVDWPAGACWRELLALAPDALVLLSVRRTSEEWWKSANATIFERMRRPPPPDAPLAVTSGLLTEMTELRLTPDWNDPTSAIAAYDAHNAAVRAETPPQQLLEWRPHDGWNPLCRALDLPVPTTPFPHTNSKNTYRTRHALGVDRRHPRRTTGG